MILLRLLECPSTKLVPLFLVLFPFLCLHLLVHCQPFQDTVSPTVRSLSKECDNANETKIWCGTHPPGCEDATTGDYTCDLITTIRKFDLPCIKSNLQDAYIQSLCSKRFFTFLVTLYRLVSPDSKERSCPNDYIEHTGKRCIAREFVAVSFTEKSGGADPEDDDVYYVCTVDHPHVTTWTMKGTNRIFKHNLIGRTNMSYRDEVFPRSGIGVYWENIGKLKAENSDFFCQFIISVEDEDMQYVASNYSAVFSHRVPLTVGKESFVKMAQGMVLRSDAGLVSVSLDGVVPPPPTTTAPPPGPPPPPAPPTPPPVNPDFHNAEFSKPLNLSILTHPDLHFHDIRHSPEARKSDEKLFEEHWAPVFLECQEKKAMCFVIDDDSKCFRPDEEKCDVLASFKFSEDFSTINVSLLVENYPWGGFSFSLDRLMGDDIGFYCQDAYDFISAIPLINFVHAADIGNDTAFLDLIKLHKNESYLGVEKRLCSWTMATTFNASQGPFYPENEVKFDLVNEEYNVMLAAGGNQLTNIAYHHRRTILKHKFSKKLYEEYTSSCGVRTASTLLFRRFSHSNFKILKGIIVIFMVMLEVH